MNERPSISKLVMATLPIGTNEEGEKILLFLMEHGEVMWGADPANSLGQESPDPESQPGVVGEKSNENG